MGEDEFNDGIELPASMKRAAYEAPQHPHAVAL